MLSNINRLIRFKNPLFVRNFHPAALFGLLLFKKAVVLSSIQAYGLPRVYRRVLEQNRLFVPEPHQKATAKAIRTCITAPTQLVSTLQQNEHFLNLLNSIAKSKSSLRGIEVPRFLVELSQTITDFVRSKK